jgi:hypothetical protein
VAEKKKDDETPRTDDAAAEAEVPAARPDETVEGGRYIVDAVVRNGKTYGGRVVNAHGETLAEFGPKELNTGRAKGEK